MDIRHRTRITAGGERVRQARAGLLLAVVLCLVLGLGTACAGSTPPGATGPSVTAAASSPPSAPAGSPEALVWTELDGGGRVRHPAAWHAFALPLGLTPGSHLVLALSTGTRNPCRWTTSGGTGQGSCWRDRLAAGAVEVVWATQLPRSTPAPPARTWSAADARCAALGGIRSLTATVPMPEAGSGQPGFVVTACLAGPGAADHQEQVDAVLDSLRP